MNSIQIIADELASAKLKSEQATLRLAEKDQENASLREELAQLREIISSTPVYSPFYSPPPVVHSTWEHSGPQSPPNTTGRLRPETPKSTFAEDETDKAQRTDSDLIDHIEPDSTRTSYILPLTSNDEDPVTRSPARPSQYHNTPSGGWPNDPPTPTGWGNQSAVPDSCDQAADHNSSWDHFLVPFGRDQGVHGDSSWEKDTPSWAIYYSNNTGQTGEDFQCEKPPKWQNSRTRPGSKDWLHPLRFPKAPHTMSDEMCKDIIDLHVLPLTTRLDDDAWLESDLQDVRVDDESLLQLLSRGKQVAQKCLWTHMDKYEPNVRERYFPGGWHQVKLERDVLRAILPGRLGYRANDPELAYDAALSVVPLRNAVCHWSHGIIGWGRHPSRFVDKLLKDLQKFAINLYDEESAMAARELRDEARQAVEDTVSELEAVEPVFDEYEFKYHHKDMFKEIEMARNGGYLGEFRFPDVILRVAKAWSRRHSAPKQTIEDPVYQTEDQSD